MPIDSARHHQNFIGFQTPDSKKAAFVPAIQCKSQPSLKGQTKGDESNIYSTPNVEYFILMCNLTSMISLKWSQIIHDLKDRVFFSNQTYLPSETPAPLRQYRKEELVALSGDGTGELQEWDRIYDYAYYNDLGDPDKGIDYARPVLGGSAEYPYPRRGRTGRPPTKTDPKIESRLPLVTSLNIYVPRDERFGHLKLSDFLVYSF